VAVDDDILSACAGSSHAGLTVHFFQTKLGRLWVICICLGLSFVWKILDSGKSLDFVLNLPQSPHNQ
jgi:hypothetical protein